MDKERDRKKSRTQMKRAGETEEKVEAAQRLIDLLDQAGGKSKILQGQLRQIYSAPSADQSEIKKVFAQASSLFAAAPVGSDGVLQMYGTIPESSEGAQPVGFLRKSSRK